MEKKIVIEKNVAIPKKGRESKYLAILSQMEVSDSILVDRSQLNWIRTVCKDHGIKISSRTCEGGFRVWRIE
jgi:hypothetical protein